MIKNDRVQTKVVIHCVATTRFFLSYIESRSMCVRFVCKLNGIFYDLVMKDIQIMSLWIPNNKIWAKVHCSNKYLTKDSH